MDIKTLLDYFEEGLDILVDKYEEEHGEDVGCEAKWIVKDTVNKNLKKHWNECCLEFFQQDLVVPSRLNDFSHRIEEHHPWHRYCPACGGLMEC